MDEKALLEAIGQIMDTKLAAVIDPVNDRIDTMSDRMDAMQADLTDVKQHVASIDQRVANVEERVTSIEQTQAEIIQQVILVEKHVTEVEQTVTRVAVTQENTITKSLNLLAEGHVYVVRRLEILDKLVEKVEDIQDTVSVLKHAVFDN